MFVPVDKSEHWTDSALTYTLPSGETMTVALSLYLPSDPAGKKGIRFDLDTTGKRERFSYPIKKVDNYFVKPFDLLGDLSDDIDFIKTEIEYNFLHVNGLYTKTRKLTEERAVKEKLMGRVPNDRLDDLVSMVVYDGLSIPAVLDIYDRFQNYNPMYYQD